MRLVPPERGLAVDHERANRRAEALGREPDRLRERRIRDVCDPIERVADDVELELRLRIGCHVLPTATAATLPSVNAWRSDARGRCFEHLDHAAPEMVGPVRRDLDPHPLAREGAVDQRDAPVVDPAERITAGNHARCRQLHPSSEARILRD